MSKQPSYFLGDLLNQQQQQQQQQQQHRNKTQKVYNNNNIETKPKRYFKYWIIVGPNPQVPSVPLCPLVYLFLFPRRCQAAFWCRTKSESPGHSPAQPSEESQSLSTWTGPGLKRLASMLPKEWGEYWCPGLTIVGTSRSGPHSWS